MLQLNQKALENAEGLAAQDSPNFLDPLRTIPLDDFAQLLFDPLGEHFPNLATKLPSMPPEEFHRHISAATGKVLIAQSVAFMRLLSAACSQFSDGSLRGKTILDYGCGWGRLMRLALYYSAPNRVYGCDPQQRFLDACTAHGVVGNLALSTIHPTEIPFGDVQFDVIYAFSVLTHTSARATDGALDAMRRRIAPNGLCAVTIRPVDWWLAAASNWTGINVDKVQSDHARDGFAFVPLSNSPNIDGDLAFGNTSMTLEYLHHRSGWTVAGYDRTMHDPTQIVVFLRPT